MGVELKKDFLKFFVEIDFYSKASWNLQGPDNTESRVVPTIKMGRNFVSGFVLNFVLFFGFYAKSASYHK